MDGTPNPALEAASCECAIVSNHVGNMPEFIKHGVNGLFVGTAAGAPKLPTVDEVTVALSEIVSTPLDDVEEMGRAARRTVEAEWTWRTMAAHYETMWRACL
jgi:glycosyltransferase involved in cell wall biosynthesis